MAGVEYRLGYRASLIIFLSLMLCGCFLLTYWGRMTHICVGNLTIIGPDNDLSPGRRLAIIWTNAAILLIGPMGTLQWNRHRNSYIFIQENAFQIVVWKMAAILSWPQCVNSSPPKCRIHASGNWSSIVSGNGLSPVRCQAITWSNAGLLSIGLPGNSFQWNLNRNCIIFMQENAFENVIC